MHVSRDTNANTGASAVGTLISASVRPDTDWTRTRKHAHVSSSKQTCSTMHSCSDDWHSKIFYIIIIFILLNIALFLVSDSCAQGHNCQHICINNGDSYICKCQRGYVLNADKQTCSRKDRRVCFFFLPYMLDYNLNSKLGSVTYGLQF